MLEIFRALIKEDEVLVEKAKPEKRVEHNGLENAGECNRDGETIIGCSSES